jgi:dolichol-phosphate mannosyltransferase
LGLQVFVEKNNDNPGLFMPCDMSLTVVIATYNEMENLPPLVEKIWKLLPNANILVVDDNSPDGTGAWVRDLQARDSRIVLLHRDRKEGLGRAAIAGLLRAIGSTSQWVATLDADHSHSPADLLKAVERAMDESRPVDTVIGSRYVPGGRIENWSLRRRWASRIVNAIARRGCGLVTRDNTGALRVYRSGALKAIGLESLRSRGHVYLPEVLVRLQHRGATITEVPITFRDRSGGQSTLTVRGLAANLGELLRLIVLRNQP